MARSTTRRISRVGWAAAALLAWVGPASADFEWLIDEVKLIRGQYGSGTAVVVNAAPTAEDRAGVFIQDGGTTEVLLLYRGRSGRPTRVQFHGSTPLPAVAGLPKLPTFLPSGLPRELAVLDRGALAGKPALRPAAIVSTLLDAAAVGCDRIAVYDDVFFSFQALAPGTLAAESGLYQTTVSPINAAGVATAGQTITHLDASLLAMPDRLLALVKDPPTTTAPLRSFGLDQRLGYEFCSAGGNFYYRLASRAAPGGWQARPHESETEVRKALKRCEPFAGAGHREKSAASWTPADIESLFALSCLDRGAKMTLWHRHPRYYTLSR